MKKLLSVLIAATMMCTSFVTSYAAALDANYDVTARELTSAEQTKFAAILTEGVKGYVVELDITTAAAMSQLTDDLFGTVSGRKLSVAQLDLVADDTANIVRAAYMSSSLAANAQITKSTAFKDNKFTAAFSSGSAAASYPAVDGETTVADNAHAIYVFVKGDVKITPYVTATVTTYAEDAPVVGSEETANNVACPVLNLTGAKQPDPEVTVTGTDAGVVVTDGVNGKVWNEVKVENTTLGTNYRAKFTDGEEVSIHKFENFGEVGGTATFAVILNTIRDVANITLDIIYDAVQ